MTLVAGAKLGPYEILAPLGAGGMGEVYRARDPRLGRDVAIKVLPAGFSADAERLTRFQQEAQAAAALNHPNILAVYDIGQHEGAPYIVSELLEGATLRERLADGSLPVRKAVEYAVHVAHGLAAAHEKGIVHRDLKPENLFITADGRVKILDFGLAKLTEAVPALAGTSMVPTAAPATVAGMVLGTVGYMAPEQVRGHAADYRSDIFALGTVLYEMLSGERAFRGDTPMDTMTAILKEDPADLPVADRHIAPALERIVHRCLEKNSAARFQSAGDLAFALEGLSGSSPIEATAQAVGRKSKSLALSVATVSALMAVAGIGAALYMYRTPEAPSSTVRFALTVPDGKRFGEGVASLALSPDASRVVYQAFDERGASALYVRRIDSLDSQAIAGTEGGSQPFFSPDGQSIGFFADRKLKKIPAGGGVPTELGDAPTPRGGSWGTDDTIVFTPNLPSAVMRVSANGGSALPVTILDSKNSLNRHNWPEFLPGAQAILFSENTSGDWNDADIVVMSLTTGARRVLVRGGTHARYAAGLLVYGRASALLAIPFDPVRLEVMGEAVPIVKEVPISLVNGGAQYAISSNGALAFVPGTLAQDRRALIRIDRKGLARSVGTHPVQSYQSVSLSPDGDRLALGIGFGSAFQVDIWAYDLSRSVLTRLTSDRRNVSPIWTPDGKRVVYWKNPPGRQGLFWRAADGSGVEELLYEHDLIVRISTALGSWAPDGRLLVFTISDASTFADIWTLSLESNRKATPFIRTQFEEYDPALSPDGRWLAYTSTLSGRAEVYVQPFPGLAQRWQISADGGAEPRWAASGRELYYRNGTKMMAVDVQTQPTFNYQRAQLLFEQSDMAGTRSYDVTPDGQQFVMIRQDQSSRSLTEAHVVLGWADEMKRQTGNR